MYKPIVVLMLVVSLLKVRSQTNNEYDFIVKLNNDTVFGSVNMVDNLAKQTVCIFTPLGDSVQSYLSPYEIIGYQLYDGTKFVAFESGKTMVFVEQITKRNKPFIVVEDRTGRHFYRLTNNKNLDQYRAHFFELFGMMPVESVVSAGVNLHVRPLLHCKYFYIRSGAQIFLQTGGTMLPVVKVPLQFELVNNSYAIQPKVSLGLSYFTTNEFMLGSMVGLNLKLSPALKIGLNMDLDTNFSSGIFYCPSLGLIFTI